jgi:hypothetical protein
MRGIVLEDVQRVVLVTARHPKIQAFQRWLAQQTTAQLEAKFHERGRERERLTSLLGAPMERLLTHDAMLEQYIAHVYAPPPLPTLPPPTCRDCRHCADDRYHPGGSVCWQGWTAGPPKRLTTFEVCGAFSDTRVQPRPPSRYDIQREMDGFLAAHGIRYHAGRWKAHQHDLERQAGSWGFGVGTQWEVAIRAWLTACYGETFFVPHRWLIITDRSGATHYREVDGIERVDDTQAFVYEIKHHARGYTQLAREYIPLLRMAYPERVFTPIEINAGNPYLVCPIRDMPPIRPLASLDDRLPNGQYQLLVLPTIPAHDRCQAAYEVCDAIVAVTGE